MSIIVDVIVRLVRVGREVFLRKWSFLLLFVSAFLGSVLILQQLDLLPEIKKAPSLSEPLQKDTTQRRANAPVMAATSVPLKIEIPAITLYARVVNPTTTDMVVLDKELLNGAVRYPTSAKLGEIGNVVLFGHSSYLPIVKNQAYKTFNGIQNLSAGDVIKVYSSNMVYKYSVRSVTKEVADENTAIRLSVAGKILTLVTCNSFGAKQDRFIVTADFVESNPALLL